MKEETKYRMVEYRKICININYCFYIIQRRQFRKIDLSLTLELR